MNNVLPGFIDSLPEKDEFRARIPLGRYGRSYDEIASNRLASGFRGGGYITGQNIRVDGGITRSVCPSEPHLDEMRQRCVLLTKDSEPRGGQTLSLRPDTATRISVDRKGVWPDPGDLSRIWSIVIAMRPMPALRQRLMGQLRIKPGQLAFDPPGMHLHCPRG